MYCILRVMDNTFIGRDADDFYLKWTRDYNLIIKFSSGELCRKNMLSDGTELQVTEEEAQIIIIITS